jgi:ABC-2 type transport system permease protein
MSALRSQTAAEVRMTLRRGESVLLALGIPVALLVFFSLVDVLPTETDEPVDFLAPGILALAVMSTAFVSLAIATGFERSYGVLKRIGATPLGRGRLVVAKIVGVIAVEVVQVAVLVGVAVALGWRPSVAGSLVALAAAVVATAAFAGLGLAMAGTLPALTTLAAANALYIVLLLFGGIVIPLEKLPIPVQEVAELLPAAALSEIFHTSFAGSAMPAKPWLVLGAWAVAAPVTAARLFRWE